MQGVLERLIVDLNWARANSLPPRELVPLLRRVVAVAPAGSKERRTARRELAELIVVKDPWLSARLAMDVLREEVDERAFGVLGLAHTLLGNYRSAVRAYRRALELAPGAPEYEHNLGHLLDVALGRPLSALPHLRRAEAALPGESEIQSSLAHALLRLGRRSEATAWLTRVFDGDEQRVHATLASWSNG
jgi:tetratricopeptide (TPR) repeat protein